MTVAAATGVTVMGWAAAAFFIAATVLVVVVIKVMLASDDEDVASQGESLIAALKDELRLQWGYNHSEHCGCERPGDAGCHWKPPKVLDIEPGQDIPQEDDLPYLR